MSPADHPPPLRGVFFDLVGTLVEVRGGVGEQYGRIAAKHGFRLDPSRVDQSFPAALRAGSFAVPNSAAADIARAERNTWREIVRAIVSASAAGARPADDVFERFFEDLFNHFTTGAPWYVFPDVRPALERLRRLDVRVALVTNFDLRVYRLVRALGLDRVLDAIVIPASAGVAKPDAGIFRAALATCGVEAAEAVHIGDSPVDDVEGARNAGLGAVLIDRSGRYEGFTTAPRIRSLDELSLER